MLEFFDSLSSQIYGDSRRFLVFDRGLNKLSPEIDNFISTFPQSYAVEAGECLKDLAQFPIHVRNILKILTENECGPVTFVALGGGSVCDFTGFLASVFKRGAPLELIPSTWLCALDSAHGGKNALNVAEIKNQIGTYYLPQRISLVRSLLNTQPPQRWEEARPEAVKIGLLDGKPWTERLLHSPNRNPWDLLPDLIRAKMKIVDQDPQEKSGQRKLLNFGHTLGHVLETKHSLPHGIAVGHGIRFAIQWSASSGILDSNFLNQLNPWLNLLPKSKPHPMSESDCAKLLSNDKKRTEDQQLGFVFLQRPGQPILIAKTLPEILAELRTQGWVL